MRVLARPEFGRAAIVLVLVIAALAVATAVLGWDVTGPSYDIVADPAGSMPF